MPGRDPLAPAAALTAEHFLVIDLEATCDDRARIPNAEREIIEIGAVLVDAERFDIQSEFQSFVRPVRHPTLTPFCTHLTTIAQADVDAAPEFAPAMARLSAWMADQPAALFTSWGDFDRRQFVQDCAFHGVPYPFGDTHFNLKAAFAQVVGPDTRPMGMGPALAQAGLSLHGTHHRGIDDARNLARLLPFALRRQALPSVR